MVHELIHGLFFWLFTGSRPTFGLRLTYAYAAAPSWYIPRAHYRVIGLAPLVIIGLVCLLLIAVAPAGWIVPLALVIALNTSGAVGDLLVIAVVNRSAPDCLINDRGDGVMIYEREKPIPQPPSPEGRGSRSLSTTVRLAHRCGSFCIISIIALVNPYNYPDRD